MNMNSGMVGDLRLDDLPSVDALKIPGSRDGEQRIVRNGDIAELYVWNGAAQQWQKVQTNFEIDITTLKEFHFICYEIQDKHIEKFCFFYRLEISQMQSVLQTIKKNYMEKCMTMVTILSQFAVSSTMSILV
jgi:hypothetical protein